MNRISFERDESNGEAKKISFDIKEQMDIKEFKIICKRLASAIGYRQLSIEKEFGYETDANDKPFLIFTECSKSIAI